MPRQSETRTSRVTPAGARSRAPLGIPRSLDASTASQVSQIATGVVGS